MMGKLANTLNAIFGKVDNTEKRYEVALQAKEESLLVLQLELQEKQLEVTELHKMYLLADISDETFNIQSKAFQLLQDKYNQTQQEVKIIQQYKTDDVTKLLEELKATQKEHQATHHNEIRQMQLQLLQAKAEYLNKMREMKDKYDNTVQPHNKIQSLEQKLGLRQHTYASSSHDGLNNIRVGDASYINLQVSESEVFNALYTGDIDGRLQKIITEGLPE